MSAPPSFTPPPLTRHPSLIEEAIEEHGAEVRAVLAARAALTAAPPSPLSAGALSLALSVPSIDFLSGCVFVGHTATDLDSIGSAIGAAELFGGVAARASDINTETAFALSLFHVPIPPPFLEIGVGKPVVLVDHNQVSQMTAGIEPKLVRGIIDHHAMQSGTLVTELPIYVDIRPWGSACTIIAHTFVAQHKTMTRTTAGLLLCGILSDTLNLRSPTATAADRILVGVLAQLAAVADPPDLAKQLFKAKSKMLTTLSSYQLIRGDNKTFTFRAGDGTPHTLAFGVIETVDEAAVLEREAELLLELRAHKLERGVEFSCELTHPRLS